MYDHHLVNQIRLLTEIAGRLERIERILHHGLAGITEVLEAIAAAVVPSHLTGGHITFEGLSPGGLTMIVVKDTQATVPYTIIPPTVTDARGRPVPQGQLVYAVASDPAPDAAGNGPGVVITPDPSNPLAGTAGPFNDNDDGTPATAAVTVSVKLADGTLVGSFGQQFTITAGDPAAIKGGSISFSGLVDQP